jgi:hypothetical protein
MSPFYMFPCLHVAEIPQMENRTSGKQQLQLFAAHRKWKRQTIVCFLKTETEVCFPWSANVKWNHNRRLLFQQTMPIHGQ